MTSQNREIKNDKRVGIFNEVQLRIKKINVMKRIKSLIVFHRYNNVQTEMNLKKNSAM